MSKSHHSRSPALKAPPRCASPATNHPTTPRPTVSADGAASILDGVRDQHGDLHIRFGTERRSAWFAVAELLTAERSVFARLARVGGVFASTRTRNAFKEDVETYAGYRVGHVATMPGWIEGYYAFGDGTVLGPRGPTNEVIVAFELNPKFSPRGTLEGWQHALGPFVAKQSYPLFVLGLSFAAAVMRFAPSDYINVLVELVGPGEIGKSTLGALAASVWAGNPDSACAGGELWDTTLAGAETTNRGHRDALLFRDEGNLMGGTLAARSEFVRQVVFKSAETAGKRRFGDPLTSEHVNFALLSTTNAALTTLVKGRGDDVQALRTRMITLTLDRARPFGIFDRLPNGYDAAKPATEALRQVVDTQWGSASRHFVEWLARQAARDEVALRSKIEQWLGQYREGSSVASARHSKGFALIAVAGELARRSGTLRPEWGSVLTAVRDVEAAVMREAGEPILTAEQELSRYVTRNRAALIDGVKLTHPLSEAEFARSAGVVISSAGCPELIIASNRIGQVFSDSPRQLKELRARRRVRGEGGRQPKLLTKPPRNVCHSGRAYRLILDSQDAGAASDGTPG